MRGWIRRVASGVVVVSIGSGTAAAAQGPQAPTPRELPARAEDSPRWAEAQRALEAAQAVLEQARQARQARPGPVAPEQPRKLRALTPEEERELAEVRRGIGEMTPAPGARRAPPGWDLAKFKRLKEREEQLLYADIEEHRAAQAAAEAARVAADQKVRDAEQSVNNSRDAVRELKDDLELIHRARRAWEPHTVAVTAAELSAAPERFVGRRVRLYDVTLIYRAADVGGTPLDGRWLDHTGVIADAPKESKTKGRWRRTAFLDVAGGRLPETFEQMIPASERPLKPGQTADVYGRIVRLPGAAGGAERVVFLCEGVVPHCHWSGPPAPGFLEARAAVGGGR